MDGNYALFSGRSFHAGLHVPLLQIDFIQAKRSKFLRTPAHITLHQDPVNELDLSNILPQHFHFIFSEDNMRNLGFFFFFYNIIRYFKGSGIVFLYDFIFQSIIQHEIEHGFHPCLGSGRGKDLLTFLLSPVLNSESFFHTALNMAGPQIFCTHVVDGRAVGPAGSNSALVGI